jgi:DNA-binding transcriptional LysR family regulator
MGHGAEASARTSHSPVRTRVIEHELLRVFVTVVDYGGFTAAGQVLHRTQAAVSLQIKRLEETIQAPLLQHPRRTVQLTRQGEIMLEYARRMLSLNDEALSAVRDDELAGRVRIGAINHYASRVLPPVLAEFCELHPEVQIEVNTGVAAEMDRKLGSTYDLTINISPEGQGEGVLMGSQQPLWVTSARHFQHQREPLPLALLPNGSLFRRFALEALARQGRAWHAAHESTNLAAIEAAVEAGLAVAIFQREYVNFERLRELTEEEGFQRLPRADVLLHSADRYLSRATLELREFLLLRLVSRNEVTESGTDLRKSSSVR